MVKKPLVSIVLPCYNHGRYLPFFVKTIQDQGIEDIEIIIVNDASTDDSLKIAKSLASKDERIRVVTNKKNRGCFGSLNESRKYVKGKYIFHSSCTDGILPGFLKKTTKILEEHPEVGFVFSGARIIDEKGRRISDPKYNKTKSYIGKDDYLNFIQYGWLMGVYVVRKDVLEKTGYYKENLPLIAEWEMHLQLAKNAKSAYIHEPLALTRIHEQNLSSVYPPKKIEEEYIWAIEEHLKTNPSKKVRRYLYANMNYSLGTAYYHRKDYLNTLKYLIKSLKNPFCILAHLKTKYKNKA